MISFKQFDERFYSKPLTSYTSDEEYDFNKRIWENNELPIVDPFELAHSMLKDDLWKWFLGYTSLSFDISFNYSTQEELFDQNGIITDATTAKYINGVRARNFGPKPTYHYEQDKPYSKGGMSSEERKLALKDDLSLGVPEVNTYTYNPIDKNGNPLTDQSGNLVYLPLPEDRYPMVYRPECEKGIRYEVGGSIAPEFDFLLHEGYRYLNKLYPDHPDYTTILTNNEINDEFNQAANFINFRMDCSFYDWLSTQLNYKDVTEEDLFKAHRKEALKLKHRNLTQQTFRRKLFGSKSGYNMFGSEIFQNVTIFPVAEYLPLIPYKNENIEENNKDFKWYKELFSAPDNFTERSINYTDVLIYQPFRLVDFNNGSYDLENRYKPPVKIRGTAYPTPLSPYDLYEYPMERDLLIPLTMEKDFYEGQKVWIGDRDLERKDKTPAYINAMYSESFFVPKIRLSYKNENLETGKIEHEEIEEGLVKVQVTAPVFPIYTEFNIMKSIETLAKEFQPKDKLPVYDGNYSKYLEQFPVTDRKIKVAVDVHQKGNIFLPAQQFLSLYKEHLSLSIDRTDVDNPIINYFGTNLNNKGILSSGELLVKKTKLFTEGKPLSEELFASEVCGLEGGKLYLTIAKKVLVTSSQKKKLEKLNKETVPKYGICLQLSPNNSESGNRKIVFFGKPILSFAGPDNNNQYHIDKIVFYISAIPHLKSNKILNLLYNDFNSLVIQKIDFLNILSEKLIREENGVPKENFFDKFFLNEIKPLFENYTIFKNNLLLIPKEFEKELKALETAKQSLENFYLFFDYNQQKQTELSTKINDLLNEIHGCLFINPKLGELKDKIDLIVSVLKEYQNIFFEDLNTRFPITQNVENIEKILQVIQQLIVSVYSIIENIEPVTNEVNYEVLTNEYNKFYELFEEFNNYFEYSNVTGGLFPKIKSLLTNFKKYADDAIFSIKIQPVIEKIYFIINKAKFGDVNYSNYSGGLKAEVKWIFDLMDTGHPAPYPILKAKNFVDLLTCIDEYKELIKSYKTDDLDDFEREINSARHEVYNVINTAYYKKFDHYIDILFNTIEKYRKPYIINPEKYGEYLSSFVKEIKKFHDIFWKDLVDMPVFDENYKVRFPIERTIRETLPLLDNLYSSIESEHSVWTLISEKADKMSNSYISENFIRKFHYDDIDFEDNCNELIRQSLIILNRLIALGGLHITDKTFDSQKNEIISLYFKHNSYYKELLSEVITTDLDRSYYSFEDVSSFTVEEKQALKSLQDLDKILDTYIPNKNFLLKPLPENIYQENLDFDASYSLLINQDLFLYGFNIILDNFNVLIDYSKQNEFGSGILENFIPGFVNTVEVAHNGESVEGLELQDKYISTKPFINKYSFEENGKTYEYHCLNKDIALINSTSDLKFSFCKEEWLELFLPENKKLNIEGDLEKRDKLVIESFITKGSNKIFFTSSVSKERVHLVTTGDKIIGPNIGNDVYVQSIDTFNYVITTNKPMTVTGKFILTFLAKINLFPRNLDYFDYRKDLSFNKLVNNGSVIDNALYTKHDFPNASQYPIRGCIDTLQYQKTLLNNLKTNKEFFTRFNHLVRKLHGNGKTDYYALPSVINTPGFSFLDVNAYKLYHRKDEEYLMVTDVLDYFENYKNELSRASDVLNIGVNITATTDSSGFYSDSGEYTDSNIKLRFTTTPNWDAKGTKISYVELGSGELKIFKKRQKKTKKEYESIDRSYYGYDVYGPNEGNLKDGGGLWSSNPDKNRDQNSLQELNHVDIPELKYYLGEYEVHHGVKFPGLTSSFTTIQFSILKRQYILSQRQVPLKQISNNFIDNKIVSNFSEELKVIDNVKVFENNISTYYLGEWEPSTKIENDIVYIDYPKPINNWETGYFYYSITISKTLTGKDPYDSSSIIQTLQFKEGTILICKEGKWEVNNFSFIGLLGTSSFIKKELVTKLDNLTMSSINTPSENNSLQKSLVVKILSNYINIAELDNEDPLEFFKWLYTYTSNSIVPTDYENIDLSKITKLPEIHWFFITGYENINDNLNKTINNLNSEALAIAYFNEQLFLFKMNICRMFYQIKHEKSTVMSLQEWKLYCGVFGGTKSKLLPWERLQLLQNEFQLPSKNILKGSVNCSWITYPHFLVEGNRYTTNGFSDTKELFDITLNKIFYDKKNYNLYSFDKENSKFRINQKNHKYFKNTLFLYAQYESDTITKNFKSVNRFKLEPIPNISFDTTNLSLLDRILKVEEINIRTPYSYIYEPTMFSNYITIESTLNGFKVDNDEVTLSLGWLQDVEPKNTANKFGYVSQVKKILPIKYDENGNYIELSQKSIAFPYNWDGKILEAPKIQSSKAFQESSIDQKEFKYYKNALILEGKLDTANPNKIDFSDNPKLKNALTKIALNDKVLSIVALSNSQNNSFYTYKVVKDEPGTPIFNITHLDYHNGYLIGANNEEFFYYPCLDLTDLGVKKDDYYEIKVKANKFKTDTGFFTFTTLNTLAYDEELNVWIFAFSKEETDKSSAFFKLELIENGFNFSQCYNRAGIDINTYDKVKINNEEIFARDLSMFSCSGIDNLQSSYLELLGCEELENIMINGSQKTHGHKIDKTTTLYSEEVVYAQGDLKDSVEYTTIKFWAKSEKNTSSLILDFKNVVGTFETDTDVKTASFWYYNTNTDLWEKTNKTDLFKELLTLRDSYIPVTVHFVSSLFLNPKKGSSKFKLYRLPKPGVNTFAIVLPVITEGDPGPGKIMAQLNIKPEKDALVKIYELSKKLPPKFNEGYNLVEGVYSPYILENTNHALEFYGDKFFVSNKKGYQALVVGSSLFIKSPTRLSGDKEYASGFTKGFYWKRASLPSRINVTYKVLSEMTLEEAYDFVNNQINSFKKRNKDSPDKNVGDFVEFIINHPVQKFVTDKDLPIRIVEKDFCIINDEHQKRALFIEGEKEVWQSLQDSQFILGNKIDVYLKKQNYLRYLADYYEVILGEQITKNFFTSIKDIQLTDKKLIIQTHNNDILSLSDEYFGSREEIENYNLWDITSIDDNFIFSEERDVQRKIYWKDKEVSLNLKAYKPSKAFTLINSYIDQNISIYVGYLKATQEIKTLFKQAQTKLEQLVGKDEETTKEKGKYQSFVDQILQNFPNNSSINNDVQIWEKEYPIIYYSTDNKNYQKAIIPTTESFIKTLTTYDDSESDCQAFSIIRSGQKIEVFFRQHGSNKELRKKVKGKTSFTVGSFGDNLTLVYNQDLKSIDLDENFYYESKNIFLDFFQSFINFKVDNGEDKSDNTFRISQSYKIKTTNTVISLIENASIEISPSPIAQNPGEILNVLVSIDPNFFVEDQSEYIRYKPQYFANSIFRVPEIVEVDSILLANRMYSPRESMLKKERDIIKSGLPSITEDVDYLIYEYETITINGETFKKYKQAENSAGNAISLCDINGKYLLKLDPESESDFYSFSSLIQQNIPLGQVAKAPIIKQYLAVKADLELENVLKNLIVSTITFDTPNIQVKSDNLELKNVLCSRAFTLTTSINDLIKEKGEDLLYENTKNMTEEELNAKGILNFVRARTIIENIEGIIQTLDELKNIFGSTELLSEHYIIDKRKGTIILSSQVTIKNTYNVPYTYFAGVNIFSNINFNVKNNYIYDYNEKPITGLYLNPIGYSGHSDNIQWGYRYDEVDPEIWENVLLKNTQKDYVYQCNKYGDILKIEHGLFFDNKTIVEYDKLLSNNNKFHIYENEFFSKKTSYNIYKIKPTQNLRIYSPKLNIYFDSTISKKFVLANIKIIKDEINVNDFIAEFLDYEDKPLVIAVNGETGTFKIENEHLILEFGTDVELPAIPGNFLKLRVNYKGLIAEKIFNIKMEKDPCAIVNIKPVYLINNIATNTSDIEFETENLVFPLLSSDSSISPTETIIQKKKASFTINGVVNNNIVKYGNEEIELDIRNLNLKLYTKQNWVNNNLIEDLQIKIYNGEIEIASNGILKHLPGTVKYSEKLENDILKVSIGNMDITVPIENKKSEEVIKCNLSKYILFEGESSEISCDNRVLFDGLYGKVLIKVPKYLSYKSLLDELGNIISVKTLQEYNSEDLNNFIEVSDKEIELRNSIPVLENKKLKIRILPSNSIIAPLKNANNPEYFYEILEKDLDIFGLDRIFIDKTIYPEPPVTINKITYNKESIPYYYSNEWKNKDNFSIYCCDKTGKYVKGIPVGSALTWEVIGTHTGDIRKELYGNVDPRINLLKPLYKSMLDWYLSSFYLEGKEDNPFNATISIYDSVENGEILPVTEVTRKTLSGQKLIDRQINNFYVNKIIPNIRYEYIKGSLVQGEKEIIDYKEGIINFTLLQPHDTYRNKEVSLFGITFKNLYSLNVEIPSEISDSVKLLNEVWVNRTLLDSNAKYKFTTNTWEDFLNRDKNIAIKWFTEMGVFDENGKLVAYCHHPKVEYRTDSQHISYTLIINEEDYSEVKI